MWKNSKPLRVSHGHSLLQCPIQTPVTLLQSCSLSHGSGGWQVGQLPELGSESRNLYRHFHSALQHHLQLPRSTDLFLSVRVFCLYVPTCTMCIPGTHRGQLQLQMFVESPCECWELNLGILEVFLIADNALSSTLFSETESHSVVHNQFQSQRNGSLS